MSETLEPERAPLQAPVRPAMWLGKVFYAEKLAPPADNHPMGVCRYCAFFESTSCGEAIDGEAEAAFGGDCQQRDVVYERA